MILPFPRICYCAVSKYTRINKVGLTSMSCYTACQPATMPTAKQLCN